MKRHAENSERPREDAGFSLVEVIVAMVLLGILATVTLPFFITGIRVTADDSATTTATAQVSAALEQLRAKSDCADLIGTVNALNQPAQQTHYDARHRTFTVLVSVSYAGSDCAPNSTATVTATATTPRAEAPAGCPPMSDNNTDCVLSTATTIIYTS